MVIINTEHIPPPSNGLYACKPCSCAKTSCREIVYSHFPPGSQRQWWVFCDKHLEELGPDPDVFG